MAKDRIAVGNKVVPTRPHWGVGGSATVTHISEDGLDIRIIPAHISNCPSCGRPVPQSDVRHATRADIESGIYNYSLESGDSTY